MIALVRLLVFGFLALSVVYVCLSLYSRSVRRGKLEAEWDEEIKEGDRDAFVKSRFEITYEGDIYSATRGIEGFYFWGVKVGSIGSEGPRHVIFDSGKVISCRVINRGLIDLDGVGLASFERFSWVDGQGNALYRDLGVANRNHDLSRIGQVLDGDVAVTGYDDLVEFRYQVTGNLHFG